jgi:hypothetical protein
MWTMRCLLCPAPGCGAWVDLVALQEHVMYEHGYSRVDLRNNTRRPDCTCCFPAPRTPESRLDPAFRLIGSEKVWNRTLRRE